MQNLDAGKVAIRVRGIYSDTEQYEMLDSVVNSNRSAIYVALKDSKGVPLSNTEYWFRSLDTGYMFIGEKSEWEALSDAEKEEYDIIYLLNDFNGDPIDEDPVSGSVHPVSSGGVYRFVNNTATDIYAYIDTNIVQALSRSY